MGKLILVFFFAIVGFSYEIKKGEKEEVENYGDNGNFEIRIEEDKNGIDN
jgi:hypothetical protein